MPHAPRKEQRLFKSAYIVDNNVLTVLETKHREFLRYRESTTISRSQTCSLLVSIAQSQPSEFREPWRPHRASRRRGEGQSQTPAVPQPSPVEPFKSYQLKRNCKSAPRNSQESMLHRREENTSRRLIRQCTRNWRTWNVHVPADFDSKTSWSP